MSADDIRVLDHGYVRLVRSWGSEEEIIEAARMSTGKGFLGWGPLECPSCDGRSTENRGCPQCKDTGKIPGDEKLLRYLWTHRHATPFEMAGLIFEVQAPIFIFREWRTHRTASQLDDIEIEPWQYSYNEQSARYVPLPDVNYRPSRERIMAGARETKNRQASGTVPLVVDAVDDWLHALDEAYAGLELTYHTGLAIGIPKEIARLVVPVGRYSRMRVSANLRNWLHFLGLRVATDAQWEMRQYAQAVATFVAETFPRTWLLFLDSQAEKQL